MTSGKIILKLSIRSSVSERSAMTGWRTGTSDLSKDRKSNRRMSANRRRSWSNEREKRGCYASNHFLFHTAYDINRQIFLMTYGLARRSTNICLQSLHLNIFGYSSIGPSLLKFGGNGHMARAWDGY
ncbi:hypothetical protein BDV96DRAFT_592042 [Lophiotrema nucula]|uniref:Uncharacterized protein n=1 Tax=Lophiotrema nucula TaxID=690887 RepID=A0A6A5YFD4_9PLEO|nr:hypothetical protein BDV96DRAFT_592042 [Lophiotrema nucula]